MCQPSRFILFYNTLSVHNLLIVTAIELYVIRPLICHNKNVNKCMWVVGLLRIDKKRKSKIGSFLWQVLFCAKNWVCSLSPHKRYIGPYHVLLTILMGKKFKKVRDKVGSNWGKDDGGKGVRLKLRKYVLGQNKVIS